MDELARIEEIARQLRRAMELADFSDCACNLHGFPSQCCHHASSLLLVLFHKCGINGFEVVRGRDPNWIEEEQFHNWTQRENIIVDITADQFGKQYPPVIVGESQWHTDIFIENCPASIDWDLNHYTGETKTFDRIVATGVLTCLNAG